MRINCTKIHKFIIHFLNPSFYLVGKKGENPYFERNTRCMYTLRQNRVRECDDNNNSKTQT